MRAITDFNRLYYAAVAQTWEGTYWRGVKAAKYPTDLWIYQEIIHERRPDLIVETGTYCGGSALYLADVCEAIGHGEIISIDINHREDFPKHSRLSYITGSSVDPAIVAAVNKAAAKVERIMVILDSDHSYEHVAAELGLYQGLVSPGDYLVVEDTNSKIHNEVIGLKTGADRAVREFLPAHPEFEADRSKERLMLTANPSGYLRRTT